MKNSFKRTVRAFSAIIATLIIVLNLSAVSYAETNYQKGVVLITSTVNISPKTYGGYIGYVTTSGHGTGFAVGKPGDKIQYIATCAHVVHKPSGVYSLIIDNETDEIYSFDPMDEGTVYPNRHKATGSNGHEYTIYIDYFEAETVDITAIFSNTTGDRVSLNVVQLNTDVDMALCRLGCEPTDKLSALPLQLKDTIDAGIDIMSVGYPSISMYANVEKSYDKSDSTMRTGIISKKQHVQSRDDKDIMIDAYEIDAELSPGMSGGPVISKDSGAIIGINAFMTPDIEHVTASRYAICIDYLTDMLDKEKIPYSIAGEKSSLMLILIIAGGVLILAAIILLIVLLTKKKPAPSSDPTPVMSSPVPSGVNAAGAGGFVNTIPAEPMPVENKYYLMCTAGPLAGKKFGISNRAVIGRDRSRCNVVFPINQPGVSGKHCEIRVSGGTMTLCDCGSSYGTFLSDGTKLTPNEPVIIRSGSSFWLGSKDNAFTVKY